MHNYTCLKNRKVSSNLADIALSIALKRSLKIVVGWFSLLRLSFTAWKVSIYGVFSGPSFWTLHIWTLFTQCFQLISEALTGNLNWFYSKMFFENCKIWKLQSVAEVCYLKDFNILNHYTEKFTDEIFYNFLLPLTKTRNRSIQRFYKRIHYPLDWNSTCCGEGASHQDVSTQVRQREELNWASQLSRQINRSSQQCQVLNQHLLDKIRKAVYS